MPQLLGRITQCKIHFIAGICSSSSCSPDSVSWSSWSSIIFVIQSFIFAFSLKGILCSKFTELILFHSALFAVFIISKPRSQTKQIYFDLLYWRISFISVSVQWSWENEGRTPSIYGHRRVVNADADNLTIYMFFPCKSFNSNTFAHSCEYISFEEYSGWIKYSIPCWFCFLT